MRKTIIQLVLVMSVSLLFMTNCEDITDDNVVSPEDSAAAIVLVADANASLLPLIADLLATEPDSAQTILNGLNLSEAHGLYVEAHELDWRNQEADFGVGFTSVLILSQNTALSSIFGTNAKVFEPFRTESGLANPVGYGFGLPLSSPRINGMIASYYEFPLASARMKFEYLDSFNTFQNNIENTLIPMIDASLEALDSLDNDPEFLFTLGTDLQLDIIDITAMESSLFALQGIFKSLTAYNYDINTQDTAEIISGLSLGSAFGTLTSTGATVLSDAHSSALLAMDRAAGVISLLEAESPAKDHFFARFNRNALGQAQSDLNALANIFSGISTIEYGFSDERGDVNIDGSISIDISQYYLNPVADLKTLFPLYTMSTLTAYHYSQLTLEEEINFEEAEVLVSGLDNTPISINIQYSESNRDTTALVSIGFLTFDLLTANPGDLPEAIWDLWAEFLLTVGDYSGELFHYPEISFQWSGFITTGSSLLINGDIAIDYLERTSSYIAPDILWSANTYSSWLDGWSDPTVHGLFPDFTAEDLAYLLGVEWE